MSKLAKLAMGVTVLAFLSSGGAALAKHHGQHASHRPAARAFSTAIAPDQPSNHDDATGTHCYVPLPYTIRCDP